MDEMTDRRPLRWAMWLPALVTPFVLSWFYFVWFPGTAFGNAFYTVHKIFLIAWPLLACFVFLRGRRGVRGGGRPRRWASLVPGAAFGLLVVGLLFLLLQTDVVGALLDENRDRIVGRIHDLGMADHFLLFACFLSVIHSAMEEFYWRWFAYGQGKLLIPSGWACAVAAIGFASHHIVIVSQFLPFLWAIIAGVAVAIGGAFWSWLMDRYQTLVGAWFSHMIVDFGLMWLGWGLLK